MIGWWTLVLLGVVQGLTEFLPVSSSGHLVVLQQLVEVGDHPVVVDLVLHVGTLAPALWFFREDVRRVLMDPFTGDGPIARRPGVLLATWVVLASVPTAAIGLLLEDTFEALFGDPASVAFAFLVTATLLWITPREEDGPIDLADVGWARALALGVAQGLAITPGISRSGTTIAVALLMGLRREVAIKLSFLMSVPAILGAVVLKLDEVEPGALDPVGLGLGAVAAAITGYAALAWLVAIVQRGGLRRFSYYLGFASVAALAVAAFA